MRQVSATLSITLDGVVQGLGRPDEDTRGGFTYGGWGGRYNDQVMGMEMGKSMSKPTDMLFGHRNDAPGFAKCLEEFDKTLRGIVDGLGPEDLLILTADHGNDPTDVSTDHTREYVPAAVISQGLEDKALGDIEGMMAVGATVAGHLGVDWNRGIDLRR